MINDKLLKIFNKLLNTNFDNPNIERHQVPNWDSMKHAELIIKIQNEFKIKFQVHEIITISNLNELLELVKQKMA